MARCVYTVDGIYTVSVSLRSIVHSYSVVILTLGNLAFKVSVSLRSIVHSYFRELNCMFIYTCFRLLTEYRSFLLCGMQLVIE